MSSSVLSNISTSMNKNLDVKVENTSNVHSLTESLHNNNNSSSASGAILNTSLSESTKNSTRLLGALPKSSPNGTGASNGQESDHLLPKNKLLELAKDVDVNVQIDDDVQELLLQLVDNMVDETVKAAFTFCKHRNSTTVDTKDVQFYLDRYIGMWMPGFGNQEMRTLKKLPATEAHKQRLALIKKSIKKY